MMNSQPGSIAGKRIVVTRAAAQTDALRRQLEARGAEPLELPLIQFRSVVSAENAQPALNSLSRFDWILFSSSNAVQFFAELSQGKSIPGNCRLACVGSKTAEKLTTLFRQPDFVPHKFSSRNLVEEIPIGPGEKVLYPGPVEIAGELDIALRAKGAVVKRWPIYETVKTELTSVQREVLNTEIDAITFASPSSVDSFCQQFHNYREISKHCTIACIGPMTSRRAVERKLRVDVIPGESSIPALVAALSQYFATKNEPYG